MEFALSSEQKMIVDAARRVVVGEIAPILARHPADKPLPQSAALEIIQAGARLGVVGARIPESAGGTQMSVLDYGLVYEQIPPAAAFILQPHEASTMRLYHGGTDEQRERYLADMLAGRRIGASAITEAEVGSNPREVKAQVRRDGRELVVDGWKMWISNATICDLVNVTCRLRETSGQDRLVRVLVDKKESDFIARDIPVAGLQQSHLGELVFENCRVPERNLCDETGDTARVLTMAWLANRPLIGLGAVHLAQRALDAAKEYVGYRRQFGKLIGGHQLVQQDLADMQTAVVASRLLCYHALAAIDRGERANGLSAMAKRFAVDACDRTIALAMRIHGSMGLSQELGLERLARDVRMLSIPDGTPGILALIQGRELAGIDAFR
ncbi:putative acyl-CoA dehydrogenase [Bordetella bronchiseptica MBORD678]|uniref:acyl-CoA dehydrogenase family protein n=1 Tax=Bordetella bronchiseptica TaxID=518 RepID=UPI000460EED2|nr:acyl-CoA dehydrogenase family protein [Bordetella bronchiseptica]AWP80649.1 hypothetical protein B7P04_15595 [Bordetella bronchiseptica]KAB1444020.1 acyl-CoA dehydrogenase [Bordetella bronchiseptica]KAB1568803.1 acyl-CoA dehydrogenase [Bordetella bronchiseptica]KDC35502.1 acyl-CoA dehydrogenase, C-terminal domain protein [Bordetella bronchiseptica M435/02/3]KDC60275.1 acyl-CoA dehydrogenase, C-terminal domain protein [Bordetella bronchiseptica MBORD595]